MLSRSLAYRRRLTPFLFCALLLFPGCQEGKQMVAVRGQVLLDEKPLTFGSVMLQPERGQPAIGMIQSDGTFTLSTYGTDDGVVIGKHRVRITCYEAQRSLSPSGLPAKGEIISLGKSLIPARYTNYATSGITVEVGLDFDEPLVLRLTQNNDAS